MKEALRYLTDVNAEHFPGLPHFPHHVHVGDQESVAPESALSIVALVGLIERELGEQIEHNLYAFRGVYGAKGPHHRRPGLHRLQPGPAAG